MSVSQWTLPWAKGNRLGCMLIGGVSVSMIITVGRGEKGWLYTLLELDSENSTNCAAGKNRGRRGEKSFASVLSL